MNTDLKILSAFDALERKINALDNRFDSLSKQAGPKGDKGERGADGKEGKAGKDGKDGRAGRDGKDGKDGKDGADGKDGVSVVDASIDLDNRLLLILDDGTEIDAGALFVPEAITKIVGLGGGGTSTANSGVKYTSVTTTPYYITTAELIDGRNIFGVDAGQNAFIYLPTDIPAEKLVTINNESDIYTLTIDTYVE